MTAMRFVGTNILLYFVSGDPREAAKKSVAKSLLNQVDLGLSVQVLEEFYVQSTRALGCSDLLSEDLSADQDYGGVRVVHPFTS